MTERPQGAPRVFSTDELRAMKPDHETFRTLPRRPLTVVLDRDAFLVGRQIICGKDLDLKKRKLMQAARGTERWVPSERAGSALHPVREAKASGASIMAVKQTTSGITLEDL